MFDPDDLSFDPAVFCGEAKLFPLPNLVLFPYVLQPLHVFEPRYVAMVEAALAGDKLIAMTLLRPGWEEDYEGRPPVWPIACLGKIASSHRLEDGKYNLMLLGVKRIRIEQELPAVHLYREAEVTLLDDRQTLGEEEASALQEALLAAFRKALPKLPDAEDQLSDLLGKQISLSMLTDIVAYTLDLGQELKQTLLGEVQVAQRARLLLGELSGLSPGGAKRPRALANFPPPFSAN